MTLTLHLQTFKGNCSSFDCMHSVSLDLWIKGEKWALDKDFSSNSAKTFIFDHETWFKVTAHPILINCVYVKYDNRLCGKYVCSKKMCDLI